MKQRKVSGSLLRIKNKIPKNCFFQDSGQEYVRCALNTTDDTEASDYQQAES